MSFRIKNYTSTVSAEKSIASIEQLLLATGATSILKEYDGTRVKALHFRLKVEWGEMFVILPANVARVYDAFVAERKMATSIQRQKMREQAERTAWRLMEDWVRVQLSLIRMRQAEAAQVFMPYAVVGHQDGKPLNMFQVFRAEQMKALPPPNPGA